MVKTLLARISRMEQYDGVEKTVRWEANSENRWVTTYSELLKNDNVIFIGPGLLLIGIVTQVNDRQNILCSNIQEVKCSNDQFLQLHEIYPELISRVKANFEPFIHPYEGRINIDNVINSIQKNEFVSFYILNNLHAYEDWHEKGKFKENDRIVILNNEGRIESVLIYTSEKLYDSTFNDKLVSKGKSLDEIKNLLHLAKKNKEKN